MRGILGPKETLRIEFSDKPFLYLSYFWRSTLFPHLSYGSAPSQDKLLCCCTLTPTVTLTTSATRGLILKTLVVVPRAFKQVLRSPASFVAVWLASSTISYCVVLSSIIVTCVEEKGSHLILFLCIVDNKWGEIVYEKKTGSLSLAVASLSQTKQKTIKKRWDEYHKPPTYERKKQEQDARVTYIHSPIEMTLSGYPKGKELALFSMGRHVNPDREGIRGGVFPSLAGGIISVNHNRGKIWYNYI